MHTHTVIHTLELLLFLSCFMLCNMSLDLCAFQGNKPLLKHTFSLHIYGCSGNFAEELQLSRNDASPHVDKTMRNAKTNSVETWKYMTITFLSKITIQKCIWHKLGPKERKKLTARIRYKHTMVFYRAVWACTLHYVLIINNVR